ncbi:MAG: hypothetical protein ACRYFS_03630 [Janthinobacterium lividum]
MNKSLSALFAEDRYPHSAAIALGNGQSLRVQYRAASKTQEAAVKDFLKEKFAALGFDPDVALRSLSGHLPDGEDLAAFESAFEALGETASEQIVGVAVLSRGFGLAQIIGSWSLLEGKARHELDEAVCAESCAALPDDVKRTLEALAASAQAPAEALDFFGQSPRS